MGDTERFGNLLVDREAIQELHEGRVAVKLAWAEIQSAQVAYGFVEEGMIGQLILSAALTFFGLACAAHVARVLLGTASQSSKYVFVGVGLLPLGLWMLKHTLRRGAIVLLSTKTGSRKLNVGVRLDGSQRATLLRCLSQFVAGGAEAEGRVR